LDRDENAGKGSDAAYDTATALAQDLDRFLQPRTVSARAPSTVYLARQRMRRHFAAFAAVATVVCALMCGIM